MGSPHSLVSLYLTSRLFSAKVKSSAAFSTLLTTHTGTNLEFTLGSFSQMTHWHQTDLNPLLVCFNRMHNTYTNFFFFKYFFKPWPVQVLPTLNTCSYSIHLRQIFTHTTWMPIQHPLHTLYRHPSNIYTLLYRHLQQTFTHCLLSVKH